MLKMNKMVVLFTVIAIGVFAAAKALYSVSPAKCTACSICVDNCPVEAISFAKVNGKKVAVIDPKTCTSCGLCEKQCPSKAISHAVPCATSTAVVPNEKASAEKVAKPVETVKPSKSSK